MFVKDFLGVVVGKLRGASGSTAVGVVFEAILPLERSNSGEGFRGGGPCSRTKDSSTVVPSSFGKCYPIKKLVNILTETERDRLISTSLLLYLSTRGLVLGTSPKGFIKPRKFILDPPFMGFQVSLGLVIQVCSPLANSIKSFYSLDSTPYRRKSELSKPAESNTLSKDNLLA